MRTSRWGCYVCYIFISAVLVSSVRVEELEQWPDLKLVINSNKLYQMLCADRGVFSNWLVVANMFLFSIIYGMSSFPVTFIFFKGVGISPTS